MRVVIDIPDESFTGLIGCRGRVARYLRRVSEMFDMQPHSEESSGTVTLSPGLDRPEHTAGWAVEGAPWQKSSLDIEERV